MNTATIIALLNALVSFVPHVPELVAGGKLAATLLSENRGPTADEQATIDAALEKSHAVLQGAQPADS